MGQVGVWKTFCHILKSSPKLNERSFCRHRNRRRVVGSRPMNNCGADYQKNRSGLLTYFACHLRGFFEIGFGIDFGRFGAGMAQNDLGGFQTEFTTHLGSGAVP